MSVVRMNVPTMYLSMGRRTKELAGAHTGKNEKLNTHQSIVQNRIAHVRIGGDLRWKGDIVGVK